MSIWPADFRTRKNEPSNSRKGRGLLKKEVSTQDVPCPVLDGGAIEAATLVEDGNNLKFSLLKEYKEDDTRIRERGQVIKVFPEVFDPEIYATSSIVKQDMEHSANFLRSRYPDVDVSFDLLRDELFEDAKVASSLGVFDPFRRNVVEGIFCQDGPRKRSQLLAFPSNYLGDELNISPFISTKTSITFQPMAKSIWTFNTPIRQILSSSSSATDHLNVSQNNILAVRTHGTISCFSVRNNVSSEERLMKAVSLTPALAIDSSDVKSSRIMDMAFAYPTSSVSPTMWLIADDGSVFRNRINADRKVVTCVLDASQDERSSSYWSIRAYDGDQMGIISSDKIVRLFDTREGRSAPIFCLNDSRNFVTSISSREQDRLTCLVTTSEIIWLDHRKTMRPLLGWKHHRTFDRTLQVKSVDHSNSSFTFLVSQNNALIDLYGTTMDQNDLIRPISQPRLFSPVSTEAGILGAAIVRYPLDGTFGIYAQSKDGSIRKIDVEPMTTFQEANEPMASCDWSNEMQALSEAMETRAADTEIDNISMRESVEVDFHLFYKKMVHGIHASFQRADENEALHNTIEMVPDFQQRVETDIDRMWTTYDVVFALSNGEPDTSRSDFLTGSVFNTSRGYRAFRQGKISIKEIAGRTPWHMNISPILNAISSEIPNDPSFSSENLLPYLLTGADNIPRPSEALQQETAAINQLELDLALSSDVYGVRPFPAAPNAEQEPDTNETATLLSQAAQTLSLSQTEPPPVHFGYFHPIRKKQQKHYRLNADSQAESSGDGPIDVPLGVRLLLAEWNVGSDPQRYQYRDPYEDDSVDSNATRTSQPGKQRQGQSSFSSRAVNTAVPHPQMPPTVLGAKALNSNKIFQTGQTVSSQPSLGSSVIRRMAESQLSQADSAISALFSSQPLPNTQSLPGPYGDRNNTAKKKPSKKRLGGF